MNIRRAVFTLFASVFLAGTLSAGDVKNVIWVIGDGMGPEAMGFFMQGVRYANLEEYDNMMKYLTEAVSINRCYRDWARAQGAFAKYRETEKFVRLCGAGEGKAYSIHAGGYHEFE